EFRCKCGCGAGMEKMDADLLHLLDEARDLAGTPFSLTSAYRCPKHNKAVGGVPTSAHTRGYAVDIRCVDSHSRFVILQALLEVGFRRIELAPTWIHVDNDPDKPRDVAFYRHGGAY
ncbi:YcbK family protein, partial [Bilophila wadsworthia]